MKRLIMAASVALMTLGAGAADSNTPLWLRNVKISPDGQTVAFTYKGDIWTVPVSGGEARRLTTQTSYETSPIWSPDGKQIAFASDRHGNMDIYIMPASGGAARRLTTDSAKETPESFSPDGKSIYFSAAIQAPAKSAMFPSARMTQLYKVSVEGGAPTQVLGTPAQHISFLPDGKSFIYQDMKGFENEWRKHHTSSVTRDLWKFDATTGKHTNLTNIAGEDRDPVVSADGKTLYFLAERNGSTFNVYSAPVDDPSKVTQITNFKKHPVRFLSRAQDGTLAFGWNGEIYTLSSGEKSPKKIKLTAISDDENQLLKRSVKAAGGAISPDGKQVAFTDRGDIFVTSVEHSSTKQITDSPARENAVSWHPEGRELIYCSLRDGHFNIYRAKIHREDDLNFSNATLIDEEPIIAVDKTERTYPSYSPDGKKIAFIQDRNKLMVYDVESKKVKQLTDGSTYAYRDGGFSYDWSPDSKWIVMETLGNRHDPYSNITLIDTADGRMVPITESGYTDRSPRFVMNGDAVVFLSERYGMRSHASWGSQDDVMIAFLNRDAYDRYRLSEEDYELRKELEKQKEKKSKKEESEKKKDSAKEDKKDDKEEKADEPKAIKVEDGIEDRIVRLTPFSADLADAWVDDDGEALYYLASVENGYDLWKIELKDPEPSIAARLDLRTGYLQPVKGGKTLFISGDKMKTYALSSGKTKSVSGSTSQLIDRAKEREAMFDFVKLSEQEMFYTPSLHGVDWELMTADYKRFLPHINNNYDFSEMLSELLGELNVSHTGSGYRGTEANSVTTRTGSLGLLYDFSYTGDGLKVEEIITGGPFDNAWTELRPGFIIKAINGQEIKSDTDRASLFDNTIGKKTLITIVDPSSKKEVEEVIVPISSGAQSQLLYDRWVKQRADDVKRLSNGRLGYVHIESMDDGSFREAYSDLLGKYNNCEGVVVDIRWNGGGRLHEDVEVLLSGEKYFTQVIRGTEIGDMPSRRWNKPSVMLIAEPCYSNAHGTPWVYKHKGIGKLVGMPVPGTMTSVNWVTLQDQTLYFGIPVVGYRLPDGSYLENTQLEPDIKVENTPESIVQGEDLQLRAAVESLLRDIDAAK